MRTPIRVTSLAKRFMMSLSMCVSVAAISIPAMAQQAPSPSAGSAPELTEIIVTGSRIAAPNEVSTSPIQVVDSTYISVSGRSDIADLIQLLPQNYNNALGQDLGNG